MPGFNGGMECVRSRIRRLSALDTNAVLQDFFGLHMFSGALAQSWPGFYGFTPYLSARRGIGAFFDAGCGAAAGHFPASGILSGIFGFKL